jgi:hypothetical protein
VLAAGLAAAGWTAVLKGHSLGVSDQLSSVLGGYLALIGAAVGTVTGYQWLFPPAQPLDLPALTEDLADTLARQWKEEARKRALDSPHILPLVWRARPATNLSVALPDTQQRVGAGVGGRGAGSGVLDPTAGPGELRIETTPDDRPGEHPGDGPGEAPGDPADGRLDGRFDDAIGGLATYYRGIEGGRLVVLGEPGSGKSVLTLLLTLGLLASRTPQQPVPVQLNVSSWDPLTQALDSWIVTSIARSHYDNRPQIPTELWQDKRLLPILDGLDEIPEASRRQAVAAINDVLGSYGPVVVTCRLVEYRDVIAGGSPTLHGGCVVQIEPVLVDDLVGYFEAVTWPDDVHWAPVYEYLRAHPGRPLSAALSTPLMVSLVRRNHQRLGGRPGELLDERRFPSRHAVEDHVLGQVVAAAYARRPAVPGLVAPRYARWRADQAERWLVHLARHLHRNGERDLAWWRLSDQLLSRWAAPVVGLVLGLLVTGATALGLLALPGNGLDTGWTFPDALGVGAMLGTLFWLLAMLAWFAIPGQEPGRLALAVQGSLVRFCGGFLTGGGLAAFPVAAALGATAVTLSLNGWSFGYGHIFLLAVAAGFAVIVVVAAAIGVHAWLQAPPERSAEATAQVFLRQDRGSSLAGAFLAGLTVAGLVTPVVVLAMGLVGVVTGWPGSPGGLAQYEHGWTRVLDWTPAELLVALLLIWLDFALLLLLVRAWPRFVVVRLHQAARRTLPLRLIRFLAEAHERGVLRESAGRYQFAHVRLQEHLANTRPIDGLAEQHRLRQLSRRRQRLAAVAVTAVLVLAVVGVWSAPKDEAAFTLDGPGAGDDAVTTLVFDPQGRALIAGYDDGRLISWPVPGAERAGRARPLPADCRPVVGDGTAISAVTVRSRLLVALCGSAERMVGDARQSSGSEWGPAAGLPPEAFGWAYDSDSLAYQLAVDQTGRTRAMLTRRSVLFQRARSGQTPGPPARISPDDDRRAPVESSTYLNRALRDGGRLALSPNGRFLAVRLPARVRDVQMLSEGVSVWDLDRSGSALRLGLVDVTVGRATEIAFSADSGTLTTCDNGRTQEWPLTGRWPAPGPASSQPAAVFDAGAEISVGCLTGQPTTLLARADGEDVVIWHDGSAQRAEVLHGHTDAIATMTAFTSPTGDRTYLATGSADGTVRLWDVTGK